MRDNARPDRRREVPDGKVSGLYLVLQPSGAASWAVRYRADGKPAKLTLGSLASLDLAMARKRAKEALGEIAGGKDPAAAKRASKAAARAEQATDDRVEDVARRFVDRSVKRSVGESWARETGRLIRTEINSKLGAKRLGEIRRADVHALLDGIVDRGAQSPPTGRWRFSDVSATGPSSEGLSMPRPATRSKPRRPRKAATVFSAMTSFGLYGKRSTASASRSAR
jgi:Arm DNA-binding domain